MTPDLMSEDRTYVQYKKPTMTYRLNENDVSGKVADIDSLKQTIKHILSIERYDNPIYTDDYGIELDKYIGQDIGYITADIENTLRDALTQDDRITDVQVKDVSKLNQDSCRVEFTVYTIYGNVEESLDVLQ